VLSRLQDAVSLENSLLRIVDQPAEIERIVALLHDGERADLPEAKQERAAWVGRDGAPDGIPSHALGPRPLDRSTPFRDLRVVTPRPAGAPPGQTPGGSAPDVEPTAAPFEATPTVALLSTLKDTPADWVRAGQALERSLLVATAEGLSASFMNQPLEHHDLRWQVRSPLTGVGVTQMIMRIGYGVPVPATPRRPVAEVMRQA
jgi:hypothetical protein